MDRQTSVHPFLPLPGLRAEILRDMTSSALDLFKRHGEASAELLRSRYGFSREQVAELAPQAIRAARAQHFSKVPKT